MPAKQPKRTTGELTPAEAARLKCQREAVAAELPDLAQRDRMRKEAQDEPTMSGEFRRLIHGSSVPLSTLAAQAGIPLTQLDEFLTGERTLRSDVLDRLAQALGMRFQSAT